MTARVAGVAFACVSTGAQGFMNTGAPTPAGTGVPTPAPPAPAVPNTPAPTWSTDDPQAFHVDFEEHCVLNLNYDECLTFSMAEGADFQSTTLTNPGLPTGCFRQYPDAIFVYNQQTVFSYIELAGSALCPNADVTSVVDGSANYINCYLKMACRTPDFDQQDSGELCEENQELTQNECAAIGAAHAQSGAYETVDEAQQEPYGCYHDIEGHTTVFNSNLDAVSTVPEPHQRMLCSQDMGPTDAPTPEPTPNPTPAPTITPTWAPYEASDISLAPVGEDCELHLNMEECEMYYNNQFEATAFSDINDPEKPYGCYESNEGCGVGFCVIFHNRNPTNNAEKLPLQCHTDFAGDLQCDVHHVCRKPDWYPQESFCQAGTELNERGCARIGLHRHNGFDGYRVERNQDAPNGCYIARDGAVVYNAASAAGYNNRGSVMGLCREEAHRCAARNDGLNKNKWCQKKCNKKRKKTCNRNCERKCVDTCKCNVKCADDVNWYYLESTQQHWTIKRGCAWVGQDPDTRCKLKGSFQETDSTGGIGYDGYGSDDSVRGKVACPSACGKCKTRRLSAPVLV